MEEIIFRHSRCTTVVYFDDENKKSGYNDNDDTDLGKFGNLIDFYDLEVDWDRTQVQAKNKLIERNISKKDVNNWVSNGKVVEQIKGEKFAYVTKKGVVILREDGKLITAWSNKDFDSNMKEIIKKIYGDDNYDS